MTVRFESHAEPITGYRLIDRLGSGGFGEVWRAEAPGGIFKAIKIIHGDLRNRENDTYRFAEQELKALKRVKQVRHPYLLALDRYDIVEGRLLITMELADCNLWDRFRECRKQGLPGIPREELMRYMSETAEVLDLFNDKFQLQHLDIKPQNLFLLYDHVKVADFGQVKDLEGLMAQVTGGITPVYAAPETFDGFVSRFCDQYSLACVYQELLTGQRPFDGTSMQQLLMQHLQMPPNLQPSPRSDRPALERALSKKPDDRFPNVMCFVNSLRQGEPANRTVVSAPQPSASSLYSPPASAVMPVLPVPVDSQNSDQICVDWTNSPPIALATAGADNAEATCFPGASISYSMPDLTPLPDSIYETSVPLDRDAPPEVTGEGSLRPVLIVGLGYTGQRVLQRVRKFVEDRYSSPNAVPAVRLLYVDTDQEALANAGVEMPWEGLAALPSESIYPAKLNRASHYLKPQLNGRSPLESWFDPQLLYRLPRVPATTGLRMLGRLAFCDHYRNLHQKLTAELETCLDPQLLTDSQVNTGLQIATNRPRVYLVAGLGGGTGSGMFLDMAYAIRYRLKRLGYDNPDIVALLTVPPEGNASELTPLAQANTYAAITELHHFTREDTSYTVNFDERIGAVRDTGSPFTEVYLVPGLPSPPSGIVGNSAALTTTRVATSGNRGTGVIGMPASRSRSGITDRGSTYRRAPGGANSPIRTPHSDTFDLIKNDPTANLADYIRTELFSDLARSLNHSRPEVKPEETHGQVRTFGIAKFTWPRAEVISRVARIIAPVLLSQWVTPDSHHSRNVIPLWIQDQWVRLCLEPELLATRMKETALKQLGFNLPAAVNELAEAINPKGWLQRLPDPEEVTVVLAKWQSLIGRPNPPSNLEPSQLEEALVQTAIDTRPLLQSDLLQLFSGLVEDPQFRLAGAEEAIRQMHGLLERTKQKQEKKFAELVNQAGVAFDFLLAYTSQDKPIRKLTATEFSEAVKTYTTIQFQSLIVRAVGQIYGPLRDQLACQVMEVGGCRQRIEVAQPKLVAEADIPAAMGAPGELLPPGCRTAEDAAQMFVKSLNDHDLQELDNRVQLGLEQTFGGLYEAGLNSADGLKELIRVIREQTRVYLDERLGEVDLAGMLAQRYPTREKAREGLVDAFETAKPKLIDGGPWTQKAVNLFAVPDGDGGDPIQELAVQALPVGTVVGHIRDEIYIHREYPQVPLAAIPQLGPAWSAAYRTAPEGLQSPPHSRYDVTRWIDVDSV